MHEPRSPASNSVRMCDPLGSPLRCAAVRAHGKRWRRPGSKRTEFLARGPRGRAGNPSSAEATPATRIRRNGQDGLRAVTTLRRTDGAISPVPVDPRARAWPPVRTRGQSVSGAGRTLPGIRFGRSNIYMMICEPTAHPAPRSHTCTARSHPVPRRAARLHLSDTRNSSYTTDIILWPARGFLLPVLSTFVLYKFDAGCESRRKLVSGLFRTLPSCRDEGAEVLAFSGVDP